MNHTNETRYASANQTNGTTAAEKDFSKTLDRVYEQYGNNLSAFYHDIKKSVVLEKCETVKPKR